MTFVTPEPRNEPIRSYAPGSAERAELESALKDLSSDRVELPMRIGGECRMGSEHIRVVQPHDHRSVLGITTNATRADAQDAIAAAREAAPLWRAMAHEDRMAIFLTAADLLSGPWRARMNAATMLGQSKTVIQAEIDSACELIDFWRFNVAYLGKILHEQPMSSPGVWNRFDYRPLEGFVYAITPFNFTAIAGNLPTAPAMLGNVVLWKPSPTQQFAAELTLRVLEDAGLPPGVINMMTGDGLAVSEVALTSPDFAGLHFTGSANTFQSLWRTIGENLPTYRGYPRIVGETGGKDFVLAHPSADPDVLRVALIRGAFEYQGQKCSAASRAYVPRSLWQRIRSDFLAIVEELPMGPVTDLTNFLGAVIDAKSYRRLTEVIQAAHADPAVEVVAGGTYSDDDGYFIRPTVFVGADPTHEIFTREFFGPILSIYIYEDDQYDAVIRQLDSATPYGLTGSVIARDRDAIAKATNELRFTAGNFYINDKPTGAVVGQQPFGGARASGTNDKAGSPMNLLRWASPRTIKETFVPPRDHRYPHMG